MDRELLIEIGVEELPASWLPPLTRQLADVTDAQLKAHRLARACRSKAYATPRRLTVRVARVAERQSDLEELVNGPACQRRYGPGRHSRRRRRSASRKKNGVEVADLERVETPKGTYLAFRKRQRGRAAVDALPDVMTGILRGLPFPEADALGRVARRRQGRAHVRPADSLAAVPLRRARRAV